MTLVVFLAALAVPAFSPWGQAGGRPNFDHLTDADRKVLGERFTRDVWPLLERGGKDGCVGCHKDGKIVSSLRMSGNAEKDYRMLLRDGFLLKDDAGSMLSRILDPDRKRRMPPGKRPLWTPAEVKVLQDFVNDVHAKQKS